MPSDTRKYLLFLLLLSIPLYFINIHDVHGWGDDFALYIKEAQNIASGKPYYQTNYIFNKYNNIYSPPQYPPGFPLMLAPIVKTWGLSFKAMFYFNSVLATALLFALFAYFRKRNIDKAISVCLSVLIVYSSYLLDLKGNVLADVPCLLFSTLYLAYREAVSYSWKRILLLILFAVLAIQMRSQAIFLLAAEGLFLFFFFIKSIIRERGVVIKRLTEPPSLFLIAGVTLANVFINRVIFYTPSSMSSFYGWFIEFVFDKGIYTWGRDNFYNLFSTIITYFHYGNDHGILKSAMFFIESTGLVFGGFGLLMSIRSRIAFDDIFFIVMCVMVIYYPVHDPRYFLPAVPILFYYCYTSLNAVIPVIIPAANSKKVFIAGTILYLVLGYNYIENITLAPAPGKIPQPKEMTAFSYITKHVDDADVIVFNKARALTLFTGKKAMCYSWEVSDDMNKKIFDSMGVKYMLVIHGFEDDFFKRYLSQVQRPTDSVNIAEGYTLYKLH